MREKILELLEDKGDLPVLPDILIKLQAQLKNPDVSIVDVVRLIELEPTLAGNILQISNSAYYKTGYEKITTLLMAVNKLGLDNIKQIIFSIEITKLFSKIDFIDMQQFWKHGLAVANHTQTMAVYTNLLGNLGNAYLSGLMHDAGITVFNYLIPDEYADFLKNIDKNIVTLEEQEKKMFGIDHQELGAIFIEKWWKLDPEIVRAVRHHHSPCKEKNQEDQCQSLVCLANSMSIDHGHTNSIQCYHEAFDPVELEILGLSPEEIEKMTNNVKTAIAQSLSLLGFS